MDYKDEEKIEASAMSQAKVEKAQEDAKPYLAEFERAKRKVGDRYDEHQENLAFYEGRQYELSKYKVTRPWVVRMRTPYAKVAIDTRVSSLIASDYTGQLIPMNPEDEESVAILNDFKNDEWERMELDMKIDEAIKTSAILRESYIHLIWVDKKMGKGETARDGYTEAYVIDTPSSVYIDPTALSLTDARFVSVLNRLSREECIEEFPEWKEALKKGNSIYTPTDRGEVNLGNDYATEQDDVMTKVTHYRKEDGKIKKCVIIEDMLVEETILDGLSVFPIAQMRWQRSSASPYGLALMDDLIDLQKATNAIESSTVNTAIAYSSPSYGVKKGSGVDPKQLAVAIGAPGMVVSVEGNISDAIAPLNLPRLDASVLNIKDSYILAIDRIAGITSPYVGSVGTAGNTEGGTKMAMERARIIEADVLHNIELFVKDITTILIQYISAQHSGDTVTSRKLDKATGKPMFEQRDLPEDIEDLEYSFFINLSMKTSYSKEREKELVLELYQMQHQYKDEIKLVNQLDVLESYDLPNKEVLVDRFKRLSAKSMEEKSQIIAEMVTSATKLGIDMGMVQKAIQEMMSGSQETPVTDQLMQVMQQKAQESSQLREETMTGFTQEMEQAGIPANVLQQAQQSVM